MLNKFARLSVWLDEDDQRFLRLLLLFVATLLLIVVTGDLPLAEASTWGYSFLTSACLIGICVFVAWILGLIEYYLGKLVLGITLIAVGLIAFLVLATEADACEDDLCTKRLDAYSHCIATSEYIYRCKVHKTAAEVACLNK